MAPGDIPPDDIPKALAPFERTDNGKNKVGLGPPLVKRMAEPRAGGPTTRRPLVGLKRLNLIRSSAIASHWKARSGLGSAEAEDWHFTTRKSAPIGNDQTAELFIWKSVREHLEKGGVLGFLIPAKSFTHHHSRKFRTAISKEIRIAGAANFSHLRYKLFIGAKQPGAAIFLTNEPSDQQDKIWVYSPLFVDCPMAARRGTKPWAITLDRSNIEFFRAGAINGNSEGWFRAFMLRQVDRQLVDFLDDKVTAGGISRIGRICSHVGANVGLGGTDIQTGVDQQYLLNAAKWQSWNTQTLLDPNFNIEIALKAELWSRFIRYTAEVLDNAAKELSQPTNWDNFKKKRGAMGKARRVSKSSNIQSVPIEDAITSELGHIARNIRRNLPMNHFLRHNEVVFDFEDLILSNTRTGRHSRKVDFFVYAATGPHAPEIAVEAKTIVAISDIASKYLADDGIGCFLTTDSPYTNGPLGGMLAYSISCDGKTWREEIKAALKNYDPRPFRVTDAEVWNRSGVVTYSRHARENLKHDPIAILHFEMKFEPELGK